MYISENIIKWEVDELSIAESQNIDNTGKIIIHFANTLLNIRFVEYYPNVKKIFFQYEEGEVLLEIENINLNDLEIDNPVYIERIVSYMVIKGFLKITMDILLSFFKSCRFRAIRSKVEKANGYYSVLRLADHYQIEMDKIDLIKILTGLSEFFENEVMVKLKKNENIINIINENIRYRNIWKEKGFDWTGVIYKKNGMR